MPICKLCLEEKNLINKSHIIPEFMYGDLFDDKHKMFLFKPIKLAKGNEFVKRPSSGEYEAGILCEDCDNKILGEYESYVKKELFGSQLNLNDSLAYNHEVNASGVNFTAFKNVSYQKFKIFLLSILWRASISARPFFDEINLGQHEELLRKMIFERDAGKVDDYPILFMSFINDASMPSDIVTQPRRIITKNKQTTFVFIIGGLIYTFYIHDDNNLPHFVLNETIKPTNEMNIIELPKGEGWRIIKSYYGFF